MAFNSQATSKAPTFRILRVYETWEPKSEWKETPEAYFLHVYLPGYKKNQPKIILHDASQKLRITGEQPIPGYKWKKFDQTYLIPENSNVAIHEAKFEQETLILKMQKKLISQPQIVAPKQEVEKSQQDPLINEDLEETKLKQVQETIQPTQSSTKFKEPPQDMNSDSPQTQSIEKKTQEVIHDDTLSQITKETISNNEPQMGVQELEPKPTFSDTTKTQIDENAQQESEAKPTFKDTTKIQFDEKTKKAQEELEPKPTFIEKTKTQIEKNDQKGQEEFEKKPTLIVRTKTQMDKKDQNGQQEFGKKLTFIERVKTQIVEKAQNGQEDFASKPTSIQKTKTETNEKSQIGEEEFEKKPTLIERIITQIAERAQKGQKEFEAKPIFAERTKQHIDEKVQKGKEEFEPKPTLIDTAKTKIDEKAQKGLQEFEKKPTFIERIKTRIIEEAQKVQEEFEAKPTFIERTKTQIDEKTQKDKEELESKPKAKIETNEKPQKGQEEFEPKPVEMVVTKENLEKNIVKNSDEYDEEERILDKEETKDKYEKPYESNKTLMGVKNQNIKENEIEKEKPPTLKVTKNSKKSFSRISPVQEEKNEIRELIDASAQFEKTMAGEKWQSDERHLIENVSVAVLVIVAFGAYISYIFSS